MNLGWFSVESSNPSAARDNFKIFSFAIFWGREVQKRWGKWKIKGVNSVHLVFYPECARSVLEEATEVFR